MVWMVDITCFSPGIESPSTTFSATSSPFMAEASTASEDAEARDPSAARIGGTGERNRRKGSVSRLIPRSNERSDDMIHSE